MKALLIVAIAFSLQGCFFIETIQENQRQEELTKIHNEADRALKIAQQECDAQLAAHQKKLFAPYVLCRNNAYLAWWNAYGFSDVDLVNVRNAKAYALAVTVDAGKSTPAQTGIVEAEIQSEFHSKLGERNNQRAVVGAAQQQADAAVWQAYAAQRASRQTCVRNGNVTNCF